ncbi:MAG: T9SS C-terminal target domain-containing protein [Ignavibacteriae bacterium]|nr:MAG: T9SS C-terminal target domain-containing protein [Ignavibacteriota bacterium]
MKNSVFFTVVLLTAQFLLQAQYTGGNGRGDASVGLTNVALPVQVLSINVPNKYELNQNYPNPFNPVTKIKFSIPESSIKEGMGDKVKLVVFDLLGKEAATLVNQKLSPGTYEVDWNAENYPSGIYFYKLQTKEYNVTKKMVLIK